MGVGWGWIMDITNLLLTIVNMYKPFPQLHPFHLCKFTKGESDFISLINTTSL